MAGELLDISGEVVARAGWMALEDKILVRRPRRFVNDQGDVEAVE
jgi:hypothetical protein